MALDMVYHKPAAPKPQPIVWGYAYAVPRWNNEAIWHGRCLVDNIVNGVFTDGTVDGFSGDVEDLAEVPGVRVIFHSDEDGTDVISRGGYTCFACLDYVLGGE